MLGNNLFTTDLELTRDLPPGVVLVNQRAACPAERLSPRGVAEQPSHGMGEIVRGVGRQEVTAGLERQAFGPDGRRDDRLAHSKRFENLDARSAASAQRHDVHRSFGDRRTHVVDGARHEHARLCRELAHAGAWVAADDRERDVRKLSADAREDRV
jgi:hypothetical protein